MKVLKPLLLSITLLFAAFLSTLIVASEKAIASPKIIILLGAPGSGKGTVAVKLAQELKIPHISTGDILRENVKKETALGKEAKSFMDAGKLVPDNKVSEMLFQRISEPDAANGYILDGYPRTVSQAKELDTRLSGKTNIIVIKLSANDDILIKRIVQRGLESKRSDDTAEVAKQRLKVYYDQTEPVIDYYKKKGILQSVEADKKPEEVFAKIMEVYKNPKKAN